MANVLVVDDDRGSTGPVAEMLSLFGYAVRVAYGGDQALSEIERLVPKTVLVDIEMRSVDGFELAQRLRKTYGHAIRLVAHAANPQRALVRKVADAGFNCFVSKSASPIQLALAIQGCAGTRELRSAKRDRREARRSTAVRRRNTDLRVAAASARPAAHP